MIRTPLQQKWASLGVERFPIERPDLLARLGVFGDIRRPTRWAVGDTVMPIVDVSAHREQVPTFYAALNIGAGGAGTFAAVELALPSIFANQNIVARPRLITIRGLAPTSDAAIVLRAHEYLGGAPAQALGAPLDGRRGVSGFPAAAAVLRASAHAANAAIAPLIDLPPGPQIIGPDDGFLEETWIAALQDLVVVNQTVNESLTVSMVWTEEEQGATRRRP